MDPSSLPITEARNNSVGELVGKQQLFFMDELVSLLHNSPASVFV